jgi:hypothetical protein
MTIRALQRFITIAVVIDCFGNLLVTVATRVFSDLVITTCNPKRVGETARRKIK